METRLRDNGNDAFDAVVFTGAAGLKFWALQYVEVCQVMEPSWLQQEICDTLRTGWARCHKNAESAFGIEQKKERL